MKTLCLMVVVFFSSSAALGQNATGPPDAPGVSVLQISWSAEVYNPMLDKDPFVHNREQWENERDQIAINKINAIRARQGRPAVYKRDAPVIIEVASNGPQATYVYKAKVANNDTKKIHAVEWDYVFSDPATQTEVGRVRHRSDIKIQPGKTAALTGWTQSPPTRVVSITKTGKKLKEQYKEHVVILRIEYADGSIWERPGK